MVYTPTSPSTVLNFQAADVPSVTAQFKRLSVDDQLGLLWFAYKEAGRSITPAAPGAASLQFATGLLQQIEAMSHEEQLGFMRDLVKKVNNPLTRAYGVLTNNTKLAFWYQLAEMMVTGTVVPVPSGYQLSRQANQILAAIERLDFSQQINILRNITCEMGYDPLA